MQTESSTARTADTPAIFEQGLTVCLIRVTLSCGARPEAKQCGCAVGWKAFMGRAVVAGDVAG